MMDIAGGISIFDRVLGLGRHLFGQYRKNPSLYLEGKLTSGLELAYRIIALFEAHDVSRTQIYRLLGKEFPDIKPSLNAEALQPLISAELIAHVADLFGVRKAWLEGEAGIFMIRSGITKTYLLMSILSATLKTGTRMDCAFSPL